MVNAGSLNPFGAVNLGGKMSTFGGIALVVVIVVVILGLIALLLYINLVKRQYFIRIPVYKLIGNVPTRIAVHVAKHVPFGMAGDALWRVAPDKAFQKPFKIIKWLPVGKTQTAPNEYWYFIREDGEWVNFTLEDLNEKSKKMGVRFTQEDMRLQRLATERLLEQRLLNKSFWEKWGTTIMMIIVFLVVAVCMVIIFYQFSKLLDKMNPLVTTMDNAMKLISNKCGDEFMQQGLNMTNGGVIPIK